MPTAWAPAVRPASPRRSTSSPRKCSPPWACAASTRLPKSTIICWRCEGPEKHQGRVQHDPDAGFTSKRTSRLARARLTIAPGHRDRECREHHHDSDDHQNRIERRWLSPCLMERGLAEAIRSCFDVSQIRMSRRDHTAASCSITSVARLHLVRRQPIFQPQPPGCHSRPALACVGKRAHFPVAKKPGYLRNRQFLFPQIARGKDFPQLLQHLRERGTFT